MTDTPELSIYEITFAKSDKADAVLVVDGKKLHVNKTLLSYHSDYFNALFNSDFKEKSMAEIPIEDVNFEIFATVLSLVHSAPIKYKNQQELLESLLEIADRFQLPAAKRHIELFLITSTNSRDTLIEIADKYQLNELMDVKVSAYEGGSFFDHTFTSLGYHDKKPRFAFFENLSDETIVKLFDRRLKVNNKITEKQKLESPAISVHESTFAKSDKTDAILLVDGKKLHVNKSILSYHSDYFNTLFNSNFKEKSMDEIPIEDVKFEDFTTLLSMVHLNPIAPTKVNAVNILELSDRFLIPCVRCYLEPFIISSELASLEKIRIGEKYELLGLLQNGINCVNIDDFTDLPSNPTYQTFSSGIKRKLFLLSFSYF